MESLNEKKVGYFGDFSKSLFDIFSTGSASTIKDNQKLTEDKISQLLISVLSGIDSKAINSGLNLDSSLVESEKEYAVNKTNNLLSVLDDSTSKKLKTLDNSNAMGLFSSLAKALISLTL